jgi:hypothetical protein
MSSYKKMRQHLDNRHINIGRVTKVLAGLDLRVRSADIEYRAPGESKFRITTKLIHKLVLIPVEEQTLEEEYKARECEHEKETLPPTLEQILEEKEQVPGVLKHRRLCYKTSNYKTPNYKMLNFKTLNCKVSKVTKGRITKCQITKRRMLQKVENQKVESNKT